MLAMSRDRGFVVRLAVGDARGACSSVWRFWQDRNTHNLYIAPRNIGRCLKISLHGDWFGLAVDNKFYKQLCDAGNVPQNVTSRTILCWRRGTAKHGCIQVLNILFPSAFLATHYVTVESNTYLIDPPESGNAIIIYCFILSPDAKLELAPDQKEVGRCILPTGERFIIISGVFPDFDATTFWNDYCAHLPEVEKISILPVTDVKPLGEAICLPLKEDNVLRLLVVGPEFVTPFP
jgi:hypothetical protein